MKREDAGRWRERAEEARTKADAMRDPYCKRTLLQIAEAYERLAQRASNLADEADAQD